MRAFSPHQYRERQPRFRQHRPRSKPHRIRRCVLQRLARCHDEQRLRQSRQHLRRERRRHSSRKGPDRERHIFITSANARELGFIADTAIDTAITASNAVTYEYTGTPSRGAYDFMDVVAHELDEGLAIGSALTGFRITLLYLRIFSNRGLLPLQRPRHTRLTTDPNAVVYFSYDGGNTNVAQFNQQYSVLGDSDLDRTTGFTATQAVPPPHRTFRTPSNAPIRRSRRPTRFPRSNCAQRARLQFRCFPIAANFYQLLPGTLCRLVRKCAVYYRRHRSSAFRHV